MGIGSKESYFTPEKAMQVIKRGRGNKKERVMGIMRKKL